MNSNDKKQENAIATGPTNVNVCMSCRESININIGIFNNLTILIAKHSMF